MEIHPTVLYGRTIRLEPLTETHIPELTYSAQDENIWKFMVVGRIQDESQMRAWVLELLNQQEVGSNLPFAVIFLETNYAIGMTRFMEIDPGNRSLEIGGTWYAPDYQRTVVNTEAKYLLLKYAFEEIGCVRVQLKTDSRNFRSQQAIQRIGAIREGVLRKHMILLDGYIRDSVIYSIIDAEWPKVKLRMEEMLLK